MDASEEADDAEGAHELDEPVRDVERAEVDEGHGNNEDVEVVPPIVEEYGEPIGVHTNGELDSEVDGEDEVEGVHDLAHLCRRAVLEHHFSPVLRLENAGQEILRPQSVLEVLDFLRSFE